ncbi:MAG: GTPase HflX, partial [Desulfobacterales bacterium]
MKRLFGNTSGLKASQIRRLENLYRRRLPPQFLITFELARDISRFSCDMRRQIGLLINRQGKIAYVIVGDHQRIVIPDTSEYRTDPGRLKGLRCIHTHLNNEPLTKDDLTDLALLRLDIMAAITITKTGYLHK